jgi:hypothetical protein
MKRKQRFEKTAFLFVADIMKHSKECYWMRRKQIFEKAAFIILLLLISFLIK